MKFMVTLDDSSEKLVEAKGYNLANGFLHFYNEYNQLLWFVNAEHVRHVQSDLLDLEAERKQKQEQQTTKQRNV